MFRWLREFWRSLSRANPSSERGSDKASLPEESPESSSTLSRASALRRRRPEVVRVTAGLDFGTSVTKVLYRVAARAGIETLRLPKRARGVVRGSLVPSQAALAEDGRLLLGSEASDWATGRDRSATVDRFKMLVAGCADPRYLDDASYARFRNHFSPHFKNGVEVGPEALAAAYLGTVMGEAREIIQVEVDADRVDVAFNSCVPIDQAESPAVMAAFGRVAAVSDHLARSGEWRRHGESEYLLRAAELLKTLTYSLTADETRLFLVPEAIASFQSYQQSLSRTEGLHALIDIGAGTTDISIAYLAIPRHSAASSAWYAAKSVPLAGGYVEDQIAAAVHERQGHEPSLEELAQAIAQLGPHASTARIVSRQALETIWNRTASTWAGAYRLYPGESRWKRTVTVFMCGGGAYFPTSFDVFKESWQRGWGPYSVRLLPAPPDFTNDNDVGFERLSVAYGLCTPVGELLGPDGQWHLPGKTPVVPKPPLQVHPAIDDDESQPDGPT